MNSLQFTFFALPLIIIVILSLPSSSLLRVGLYPLPALLLTGTALYPPDKGDVEETYLLGLFLASLSTRFIDYIYLQGYDTPKHFYKVSRASETSGAKAKKRQEYPSDALGRLKWSLSLIFSQRGIGWNFEVPTPETIYPATRQAFVREAVIACLEIYFGVYIVAESCRFMVGVLRNEIQLNGYSWAIHLFRNQIFQMVIALAGWIMSIISHISLLYNQVAIVCVGLGIGGSWSQIKMWPKTFGRFSGAWSVRNIWGREWHQTLRKCLSAPGDVLAALIFGDPPKLSWRMRIIRRYFVLFSAFTASGVMHAAGVYFVTVTKPMPYEDSTPITTRPPWYATAYFFVAQAIVIMLEDLVCWTLGLSTDDRVVRGSTTRWLLGVIWTLSWFTWSTTALWMHPQLAAFGYQRLGDGESGYVHVLEAVGKGAASMPFNPWPRIVDGFMAIVKDYLA